METPRVTIVDPRAPRGADVLVAGSDRPPRLSRRTRGALAVAAVLAVAAAWGGPVLAERRAQERERAAAFALADRVHVEGRIAAVFSLEPGSQRIGADVSVLALDEQAGSDTISSVRLVGSGIFPLDLPAPGRLVPPQQVLPEARVDCPRVAAGAIPGEAVVVLTVVPASGVPHEQRLPADPAQVREAALSACRLPDPAAVPVVEASGQGDELVVYVEGVRRSTTRLELAAVQVPGFAVTSRTTLPYRIPADTGVLTGFSLRVVDCAAARTAEGVQVVLRQDGEAVERRPSAVVTQPQPSTVPASELLARLVTAAC